MPSATRSSEGLASVVLLLGWISLFACNTEIINFSIGDGAPPFQLEQFPVELTAGANEIESTILMNEILEGGHAGDLWFSLDTGGSWTAYDKFTLRISWAASYPTDFSITIYNPPEAVLERVKYAHIHAVHSGVFTPPVERVSEQMRVPFTVVLEPLVFVVLIGAAFITPNVYAALAEMAIEARKESVLKAMKRK